MKSYPRYKDSGIEWLGEVPEHWSVMRIKALIDTFKGGIWGNDPEDNEEDVVCVRVADFDMNEFGVSTDDLTIRNVAERYQDGRLLEQGDLLIEKSGGGDQQLVGRVVEYNLPHKAVCSNFLGRISPRTSSVNSRYLLYYFQHLYGHDVNLRSIKQTTGIQNIDTDSYFDERVALPPLDEQRCIAKYLDAKAEQIDTLIAKKQRLIDLLQEQRTAVINRAVTQGLDPDAPMQDSGVGWMGNIPKHWDVPRTKYVAEMQSGHTPSRQHPEYWEDCTIPWFTLSDVWQLRDERTLYVTETKEMVSELGIANSSARVLPEGTVILSRTASVGFSGIMGRDMATTQDFVNWVCGEDIRPKYLLYVFRAMKYEFKRLTMGSTHQTIYMPDALQFKTPLPPLHEQDEIVEYVDSVTKEIDKVVDKESRILERLQELRTSLISEVVTGKIDVRDEVPERAEVVA